MSIPRICYTKTSVPRMWSNTAFTYEAIVPCKYRDRCPKYKDINSSPGIFKPKDIEACKKYKKYEQEGENA